MPPGLNRGTLDRLGALVAEDNAVVGLLIDTRYEVARRVARGGMGEVFLAQDRRLNRPVAMKVLAPEVRDPRGSVRFLSEARTLAEIEHPGIVPIHDFGSLPDGRCYYTMKFVHGRTLAELIRGKTDRGRLLSLLIRTCETIHHAHERGAVHLDLKPANVMVGEKDQVFVVDWGMARMVAGWGDSSMARTGTVAGTLPYMAPEQARGEADRLDRRTDVFSLGAILYEVLTGTPPGQGATMDEALQSAREASPLPPRRRQPTVAAELEAICLKALAKDPQRRYPSARALANDLRRYLDREPVAAYSNSAWYRLRKRLAAHKRVAAFAAIAAIGFAVAGAFLLHARNGLTLAQDRLVANMRESTDGYLSAALEMRRAARIPEMRAFARKTETICREVIRELPRLAEPHYRLGRIFRASMEFDRALAEQDLALSKEPGYGPARYERGLLRARNYESHVLLLSRRWTRLESERIDGERDKAEPRRPSFESLEDESAREWKRGALEDLEGLPDVVAHALVAWLKGDRGDALRLLEQAEGLEEAYEWTARLALLDGDWDRAETSSTRGHDWDRGFLPFLELRALARLEKGKRGADPAPLFANALADTDELLRLDPAQADTWLLRGHILKRWGFFEQTRGDDPSEKYRESLDAYDSVPLSGSATVEAGAFRARVHIAWACFRKNRGQDPTELLDKVMADLDGILPQNQESFEAWSCRGVAGTLRAEYLLEHPKSEDRARLGEIVRTALDDLQRALAIRANSDDGWEFRGDARIVQARWAVLQGENPAPYFEEAIADYGEALRLDANSPHARKGRANARSHWGSYLLERRDDPTRMLRAALQDLEEAIRLAPGSYADWTNKGSNLLNLGLWEGNQGRDPTEILKESVAALDRAVEIGPGCSFPWVVRGNAKGLLHRGLRRFHPLEKDAAERLLQDLEKDFAEALRLNPTDAEAHRYRGMVRQDARYVRRATADYEKAIERNPRLRSTLSARMDWCRARLAEADQLIQEGDRLAEESPFKALENYRKAVDLDRGLEEELRGRMDECRRKP